MKLVEGQLQSIENFFGLVNDQVVTLPTPERVSSLDFEQLSDSIAMTKQMLEETSDTFAALDSHNRDIGNYELLLSNTGTPKYQIRSAICGTTLYSTSKQDHHNIVDTSPPKEYIPLRLLRSSNWCSGRPPDALQPGF